MAYDGTLKFDTSMDTKGFQKGAMSLGDVIKGSGIFTLVQKGMQLVSQSIGDAVSRYDTLNQFPKVLQQMGFGADEASTATKKLANGIDGLPTTLDSVVSTAQRLTGLTKNLEKSTDTTLALNNAFLASGASVMNAERGTEQYIKMLSTGKVNSQSWLTLQETMNYALSEAAESFGFAGESAQNDLYAALQDGKITFNDFNNRIIELSNKTGGFAEVAKTSTVGIGTSWTNLKTGIVRGTANIITAIDKGLSKTRFGSIQGLIESTSKIVNNAFSGMATVAGVLATNLDILIPIVGSLFIAFAAYKIVDTISKSIAAYTAITSAMTATTALSTGMTLADTEAHSMLAAALASSATAEKIKAAAKAKGMTIDAAGNLITAQGTVATAAETAAVLTNSGALSAKAAIVSLLTGKITLQTAVEQILTATHARETAAKIVSTAATVAKTIATGVSTLATTAYSIATGILTGTLITETAAKVASTAATVAKTVATGAVTLATGVYTVVTGILTGAITAQSIATGVATAAQWLLNAAMAANPIGLVIAGTAALVGGIMALAGAFDFSSAAYKKNKKELEEMENKQEELNKTVEENSAAYKSNSTAAEGNAQASKSLLSSVMELANKEGRSAKETAILKARIDQLNKSQKGLGLELDETTGKLNKSKSQIQDYINATKAAAQEDGIIKRMDELQSQLGEVEGQYAATVAAQDGYKKQLKKGEISQREYNKLMDRSEDLLKEYGETKKTVTSEMKAIEDSYADVQAKRAATEAKLQEQQKKDIQDLATQYHMSAEQIQAELDKSGLSVQEWAAENAEALDKHKADVEAAAEQWGISADQIKTEMEQQNITLDQWVSNQEKAWQDYESAVKDKTSNVINGFKRIPNEFDMSAKQMLENLKKNKEQYAEWEKNMAEITRQLGPTAAAEFEKLGPEANKALKEILGSTKLLDEYRATFGVKLDEVTGVAVEKWDDPNFVGAPSNALTKGAEQLQGNNTLPEAVEQKIGETESTAQKAAESGDFKKVGKIISEEIAEGATNINMSGMMKAIAKAIKSGFLPINHAVAVAVDGVQNIFKDSKKTIEKIFSDMMMNINNTISSKSSTVKTSSDSLAKTIINSFKDLNVKAVDHISKMIEGMVNKMNANTSLAQSAKKLSEKIVNSFKSLKQNGYDLSVNMMNGISKGMDDNAPNLYKKAKNIANNIAKEMKDALEVHSPSRVMIDIFKNVMLGGIKGLQGSENLLYNKANDISAELLERLSISPDIFMNASGRLKAIVEAGAYKSTPAFAGAAAGSAGKTTIYNDNSKNTFTSPKALDESEQTRQLEASKRRQKWRLP